MTTSDGQCKDNYRACDPGFTVGGTQQQSQMQLSQHQSTTSERHETDSTGDLHEIAVDAKRKQEAALAYDREDHGFGRIVRNFSPSWFLIIMSTGVIPTMLHQLPYHAHWLDIISYIFFALNLALFLLFTFMSILRYTLHPKLFLAVMRHPHQSLFVAAFPMGLATLINMTALVCAPAWGHGWAIFAWVLWWIDSVIALATCFHLTFVIMSNSRSELAEMTALYLMPIVAVVMAATSGGLVANAITNRQHQLWTVIISYVFWGIGSPLSWIILTLYFLRMAVHKPLKREVVVTLLIPTCPLALEGYSIITFGILAKRLFPVTQALPHAENAGDVFYIVGFMLGIILWGSAFIWFLVAAIMMGVSGKFPFSLGSWGFIFPVGVFTLLTILIGEELESRIFKVFSCVLLVACILMWFVIAAYTVRGAISGKIFFAPRLGKDLYLKKPESEKMATKFAKMETV